MGRYSKKKKLNQQVYDILTEKFRKGFGRSRHEDKKLGLDHLYIYSENTYKTYRRECKHFINYCKSNYSCKTLEECQEHIEDYLKNLVGSKSAWTVTTKAAAICKLYEIHIDDLDMDMPSRRRQDIVRSRGPVAYDKHIGKAIEETFGAFTRCTGVRIRELKYLRGTDLIERDGKYYVHIRNGKGGKQREAEIIGSEEEIQSVVRKFRDAGPNKIFSRIPAALDNHSYRAEYCTRFYHMLARNIEDVPQKERYYCRKDLKGVVYDKKAMDVVSLNMGHTRRDIISFNYIRY